MKTSWIGVLFSLFMLAGCHEDPPPRPIPNVPTFAHEMHQYVREREAHGTPEVPATAEVVVEFERPDRSWYIRWRRKGDKSDLACDYHSRWDEFGQISPKRAYGVRCKNPLPPPPDPAEGK